MKRILIACEFSGIVREAFAARGFDAWSRDLLPTEIPGQHIQSDVLEILDDGWDAMIAFPPCTYLARSGARWLKNNPERQEKQRQALKFVRVLMNADIPYVAIENPVGKISTAIRKPNQVIQPYEFGHGETKATCLWLKGFPLLQATDVVEGREPRVWYLPPSDDRGKERSRTLPGIAEAMAIQWGDVISSENHYIGKQLVLNIRTIDR